MSLLVDTSAFLALLDAGDEQHEAVAAAWHESTAEARSLVTSNYIVVETLSLAQRRFGMEAVRAVTDGFLPLLDVIFVTREVHHAATAALLAADRRGLSFVDCTSFELMRRHEIRHALALDADFSRQGFRLVPGGEGRSAAT